MENKKHLFCVECELKAKYVRHTQFAGNHPYCETHALMEKDFLDDESDNFWEKLEDSNNVPKK
jgi:hypothetical protein